MFVGGEGIGGSVFFLKFVFLFFVIFLFFWERVESSYRFVDVGG